MITRYKHALAQARPTGARYGAGAWAAYRTGNHFWANPHLNQPVSEVKKGGLALIGATGPSKQVFAGKNTPPPR